MYCTNKKIDDLTQPLIELPSSAFGEPMSSQGTLGHVGSQEFAPFCSSKFEFAEQHTIDHINCPACIAANEALQAQDANFASMRFTEAGQWWMRLRKQSTSLKPRTHDATQGCIDALGKFFGALRLCDITPGHIRGYQIARSQNKLCVGGKEIFPWQKPAGHSCINHEICALGQMLHHAKLWHFIRPFYFPLSVQEWSPREILNEEEEERLFRVAAQHPEASLAYWVAAITNNTTAAGCELRGLRLKHLFLHSDGISEIYIPADAVKNNSRPRKIPLNSVALWAVEQCYKRALRLGCCEPDHYLFPFRVVRNQYDPTRPAHRGFLRKNWQKLRKATGFMNLEPHDLRHNCITRMLENDVPPETVKAIAGHVTQKMLEYYAHQRTRVKYAAVMAIDPSESSGPHFLKKTA